MVDRDKIEGLVRHLRQYLKHLRELATLTETQFLADPHAIGSARYYLTVTIEACLDIAGHLIASVGTRLLECGRSNDSREPAVGTGRL
jgi:uncharacterized protein YutE (UPF0331/DUF86 family)